MMLCQLTGKGVAVQVIFSSSSQCVCLRKHIFSWDGDATHDHSSKRQLGSIWIRLTDIRQCNTTLWDSQVLVARN